MASRVGTITQFAPQAPPWQLTQLDQNFTNETAAINDSSLGAVNAIATDTGSANNYAVTLPFGSPTAYNQGMTVVFIPANNNTGSSVITVSPLGSASITDVNGNPIGAGALVAGRVAVLTFIGSSFRITNTATGPLFQNPILTSAGTTTISCTNSSQISITLDTTGAPNSGTYTLQLTSVLWGAHIDINWLVAGTGQLLKFSNACTDQAGNTITSITCWDAVNGSANLISSTISGFTTYAILNGTAGRTTAGTGTSLIRFLLGYR